MSSLVFHILQEMVGTNLSLLILVKISSRSITKRIERLYWIYPNRRFFCFPRTISDMGRNSSSRQGGSAPFTCFRGRLRCFPPSHTLPPRYTYLLGRRYKCLQDAYSHSPAKQTTLPKWKSSSFPAGDFLEQPNKEERNVDQI